MAEYCYESADGVPLYVIERLEPKGFRAKAVKPDGTRENGMNGVTPVPYRLPALLKAVRSGRLVYICEGEKDADAVQGALDADANTAHTGAVATTNAFGAGSWDDSLSAFLKNATVVVVIDTDEAGRKRGVQVRDSLERAGAASIRIVEPKEGMDASDHLAAGHSLEDFITPAEPNPQNQRDEVLQKMELLKGSDPIEYHRYAKEYAKQEGVTLKAVEEALKLRRQAGATIQGHALKYNEPAPWPEPVELATALDELTAVLKRHIALPNYGAETLALWAAMTHIHSEFKWIPKLGFVSPERECGKSLAMELLALACRCAKKTDGITPAALFRIIERDTPTIIMDEMDTYDTHGDNGQEIRKLLNASSERSGAVDRCVGDDNEVRSFSVFTPIAFAGIGDPPDTVASRSIIIRMKRKSRADKLEGTANGRHEPEFSACHAKLIRAISDTAENIAAAEFVEIPELSSRANDMWHPLFAIAKVAGGHWVETAAKAAKTLSGPQARERSRKEMLLSDIRSVLEGAEDGHIASQDLCEKLVALQDSPWGECNRGKPITPAWLARGLKGYGVEPSKRWTGTGSGTARGYEISDFKDPFERYLPGEPDPFPDEDGA